MAAVVSFLLPPCVLQAAHNMEWFYILGFLLLADSGPMFLDVLECYLKYEQKIILLFIYVSQYKGKRGNILPAISMYEPYGNSATTMDPLIHYCQFVVFYFYEWFSISADEPFIKLSDDVILGPHAIDYKILVRFRGKACTAA
ncbi:hypothetical protein ACJX0J_023955, partial [Zea mays]